MHIAIFGGSGFLGQQLSRLVLAETDWEVTIVTHSAKHFSVAASQQSRLHFVQGDVLQADSVVAALRGIDVAYYFVHMMGQSKSDFYAQELLAAKTFAQAITHAKTRRLVYMGGLGSDHNDLSDHLKSRHRTGEIFRRLPVEVIELQASMIIGRGSVGYDIIRKLVRMLPIMPLPKTANTRTQPIALGDALDYLLASATVPIERNMAVQIGGPDVMTYEELYRAYAHHARKRRIIIRIPFLQPSIEAMFLDLFTPKVHSRIGRAMVESLGTEMIVTNNSARRLFPAITPTSIHNAFTDTL